MQTTNIFMRSDTLFGVCEALGEDFGFNPIFLRIPLAALLLWNPYVILSAYLGAGILVLASRLIVRTPRKAVLSGDAPVAETRLLAGDNEADALAAAA